MVTEKRLGDTGVVSIQEMHGDVFCHSLVDRFGNSTPVSLIRVKGMKPRAVTHGPGKATREFRPSAKKIKQGRVGISALSAD